MKAGCVDVSINGREVDQATADARVRSVLQVLAGRPVEIVAARHPVSTRVLTRWVTQFVEAGSRALAGRTIADEATIDHLLAIISHEMRSPLTSAALGVRLLSDGRLPATSRPEIATSVSRQLELLSQLADDVLDGAAVSLGQMALTLELVDVGKLVEQVRSEIDDGRVTPTVGRPRPIVADPRRLRQIVTNVLHNALRHGAGAVDIRLDENDNTLTLSVANHAREAVTMDDAHRWFEPFARGSARTGHGLGLYVVRALTVAHAGTTGVDSLTCNECAVGQDLRIWISLPIGGPPPADGSVGVSAMPRQRQTRLQRDR